MQIKMYVLDLEIPRRVKRGLLLVGVPAGVLFGVVAIAYASITSFSPGDPLSSTTMNANFSDLNTRLTSVEGTLEAGAGGNPGAGSIVWRDSTGAIVPVVRLLGDFTIAPTGTFEIYDAASKAVWIVSAWNPVGITATVNVGSVYANANCMGTQYASYPPPPGYSFTDSTGAHPGKYYTLPAGMAPEQITPASYNYSGGCMPASGTYYGVPYASLTTVTIPTTAPGTPPYHAEPL